jgi:carboxypeptidase Q
MRVPWISSLLLLPLVAAGAPADDVARELIGRTLAPTPILADLQELTDDIGGRPTGSPALDEAIRWGAQKFRAAGLVNAHTESYTAPALWYQGGESGELVAPRARALRVAALPFTAGTGADGITADVLDLGSGDAAAFEAAGQKLAGRWALVTRAPTRTTGDTDTEFDIMLHIFPAARRASAVGVIFASGHPARLLYRQPVGLDAVVDPLPGAMLEREEALRISRLLARGQTVRLRIVTTPHILKEPATANVVGDIRGSAAPEQVVILGAHLDSWDLGQGALDNGCNVALVIDAARQIAALAKTHPPRRTLRFVLFTGEEAGFLGSYAHVRLHRAELDHTVAMVTFDLGTGRTTGFSTGGRTDVMDALNAALAPVQSLGPFTHTTEAFLGTDNYDFLVEGIPNFVAIQDDAPYVPNYHAASDTFDKVDARELKDNTAIAAVLVWELANAAAAPGPRQSRGQVEQVVEETGLEKDMKTYGVWDDFVSGKRGRVPQ